VIGFSDVQLTEQTVADTPTLWPTWVSAIRLYRDTFRRLGLLGGKAKARDRTVRTVVASSPPARAASGSALRWWCGWASAMRFESTGRARLKGLAHPMPLFRATAKPQLA
jgi:hypothetical protein